MILIVNKSNCIFSDFNDCVFCKLYNLQSIRRWTVRIKHNITCPTVEGELNGSDTWACLCLGNAALSHEIPVWRPCHKGGYADPSPAPLSSGHLYIKDAQCADTNEKLYLRFFWFLVFELLSQKRLQNMRKKLFKSGQIYKKDPEWSDNDFLVHDFFCATLRFRDILNLSNVCFLIFKYFYRPKKVKNDVYLRRCTMFWSLFLYPWVFLCNS